MSTSAPDAGERVKDVHLSDDRWVWTSWTGEPSRCPSRGTQASSMPLRKSGATGAWPAEATVSILRMPLRPGKGPPTRRSSWS